MADAPPNTPSFRYQLLRLALQEYGVEPAELDTGPRGELEARTGSRCQWMERVLRSPEAAGVWVPETEVDQAVEIIGRRFRSPEALAVALSRVDLTGGGLRRALESELRAEAVAERVAQTGAAAEAEVRAYYDAHRHRFRQAERREARQILITVNPEYPENRPDAARRRLEAVAAGVGETVEGFAAQARRHSECPSALDGGRLGWVKPGTLYPELDRALFQLAPGGVSGVLESPLGYHLLRCDAEQPARELPFADAAQQIRRQLDERRRREALRDWAGRMPGPKPPAAG